MGEPSCFSQAAFGSSSNLLQELAPYSCLLTFELDLHHLASVLQDVPIGLKCVTGTMDADLQAQVGL